MCFYISLSTHKWVIKNLDPQRHHDKQINKKRLTETIFKITNTPL